MPQTTVQPFDELGPLAAGNPKGTIPGGKGCLTTIG